MDSWHAYPSIYALGHRAIADLLKGPVLVEEKIDGCLAPDARILTADLRYVRADSLQIGDALIGFDDRTNDPRLCVTHVTHTGFIRKPCSKLVMSDGRSVTASDDHPWLVRGPSNNVKRWRTTAELSVGDSLVAFPLWAAAATWDAGYIAGLFDGEGSLVRHGNGRILSFYQRPGVVFDLFCAHLVEAGFAISVGFRQRKAHYAPSGSAVVRGGWPEILRALGTYRPPRLLMAAVDKVVIGSPTNGLLRPTVVSVVPVGEQQVVGLSTSSSTYVGAGMLCHNSQFSWGLFDHPDEGRVLKARSKGAQLVIDAPEKMFARAVEVVKALEPLLRVGWTYRGEYLQKPKHNTLAYDRIPQQHIILFDINTAEESYLGPDEKRAEASRLGLEVVPELHRGMLEDIGMVRQFLERQSVLGGQPIEGVVVKPLGYDLFGRDKKCLMGKFVSEAFKEVHSAAWAESNPGPKDILQILGARYGTQARWQKARQHLAERGLLEGSPRDIGLLIKEIPDDILKECEAEIKEALFDFAWPHVRRLVTRGVPEWYKNELLRQQFDEWPEPQCSDPLGDR